MNYEDLFKKHNFDKMIDDSKKINVLIDNNIITFPYETNVINEIPNTDIKFLFCSHNDYLLLFINKDFNIMSVIKKEDITYPLRLYYDGLMKDPFEHVYSFNDRIKIKPNDKYIEFWID